MAKQDYKSLISQFNSLLSSVREKDIKGFYLLMGEEPYFIDILCDAIIENALAPEERDFNQLILYGSDKETTPEMVISAARRYPMMAHRNLVVVKEAQQISNIGNLSAWFEAPMPTTTLVICFTGKSADKRSSLYTKATKQGVVFESALIPDPFVPQWITEHIEELGGKIDMKAANLMAEHTGSDLRKINLECDKLIKAVEKGQIITVDDIERNVGLSKDYNIFELNRALSARNPDKAYKIAIHFGNSPKKFPLVLTLGMLFAHFNKILHYQSLINEGADYGTLASLMGVPPYAIRDYESAARNYPMNKTIAIISLLEEYDYKSKSNSGGNATEKDLLIELISKIFN